MNARTHNTLIVYYSRTGRCSKLAAALRELLGDCDMERITDEDDATGARGLLAVSIRALCRNGRAIRTVRYAPEWYDEVYLVTPVWAGTITPSVRTYLSAHRPVRCKLIACSGWTSEKGCVDELQQGFGIEVTGHVRFVVDEVDEDRYRDKLHRFVEPAVVRPIGASDAPSPHEDIQLNKEVCMPNSSARSCGKKSCRNCSEKSQGKSAASNRTKACSTEKSKTSSADTQSKSATGTRAKKATTAQSRPTRSRSNRSSDSVGM